MEEEEQPNHGAAASHGAAAPQTPPELLAPGGLQEAQGRRSETMRNSEEDAAAEHALIEDEYLRAELESHFGTDLGMKAAQSMRPKLAGMLPDKM